MVWYLWITAILSFVLTFIASIKVVIEWYRRAPDGQTFWQCCMHRRWRGIFSIPMIFAATGAVLLVDAIVDKSSNPIDPYFPFFFETLSLLLTSAGAVLGLLMAIIGWLVYDKKERNKFGFYCKPSVWGICIRIYVVALFLAAVPACIEWLST